MTCNYRCNKYTVLLLLLLGILLGAPSYLCAQQAEFDEEIALIDSLTYLAWKVKNTEPDSARQLSIQAIELSNQIEYEKGRADALHIIGLLEWSEGDMAQALNYYLDALQVRESLNDSLGLGRSFNNIGNVYFQLEEFDSAQVYYQRGLSIRQQLGDVPGLIYSYSNLGDVALQKDELFTAESYYLRGRQLAMQDSIFSALAHTSGRLGNLELQRGHKTDAQVAWQEAVSYAERSDNRRFLAGAIQEAVRMAMLNDQLEIERHTSEAHRSLDLANEVGAIDLQAEAAVLLAQLAAAAGDISKAYFYQTQYRQLTESYIQDQENKAVTAIRDQYDAEQLSQNRLELEQQTSAALSRKNTRLVIGFLGVFVVFLSIGILLYRRAYRKQSNLTNTLVQQNQELDARYDDLQEFAKIASHDLKEPVRNIGAFANLIERRYAVQLDDDGMEYLEYILKSAHQMNRLLDDLLTFSNIPRYGQLELEPTSLHQLVGEVVAEKKKEYGAFQFVGTALPQVQGYPELLRILLEQLIDNGLKFNTSELRHLEIGYSKVNGDHRFWLADNGVGIEETYQEQIFDIFRRLGLRDKEGTGMGLAISKRIIETHRGQIWVESQPGSGSCFFFTLPGYPQDGQSYQERSESNPPVATAVS